MTVDQQIESVLRRRGHVVVREGHVEDLFPPEMAILLVDSDSELTELLNRLNDAILPVIRVASGRAKVPTRANAGPQAIADRLARLKNWPSRQAKDWVYEFAKTACTSPETRALIAIGSIVRPVPQVNDVDLVYVLRGQPVSVAHRPLDVDIRIYDALEAPALVKRGHDVLAWALRFGHLICERDGFWSALRRELHELPLPDPRTSEARAVRTEQHYHELRALGDEEAAQEQLISALTHRAWARLSRSGVYPASRPELPTQLRDLNADTLASALESALAGQRVALPTVIVDSRDASANGQSPAESLDTGTERRLNEGLEDFAKGRSYGPFGTAEEAVAFLRTHRKRTGRTKRRIGRRAR